ncbi:MAG: hypothetical protein IPL26_12695 [Leptospiraceae bacterium]|nr:hypothetical protein [Leptospiraceae bacterium]
MSLEQLQENILNECFPKNNNPKVYFSIRNYFRKIFLQRNSFLLLRKSFRLLNNTRKTVRFALDNSHRINESFQKLSVSTESYSNELKEISKNLNEEKRALNNFQKDLRKEKKDLEERLGNLRKEEILLETRKSEFTRNLNEFQKDKATILDIESKFEEKDSKLKEWEYGLENKENLLKEKEEYLENQENLFHEEKVTFDELKESISEEKEILEEERESFFTDSKELKDKLEERIREYEIKLSEIEHLKTTVDLFKKDKSKEGKEAKLVVQEAIRQMQKVCKDMLSRTEELEEKYCDGSFKGFALPLDQIENKIEELKNHLEEIYSYSKDNPHIPLNLFIKEIEFRFKKQMNLKIFGIS